MVLNHNKLSSEAYSDHYKLITWKKCNIDWKINEAFRRIQSLQKIEDNKATQIPIYFSNKR